MQGEIHGMGRAVETTGFEAGGFRKSMTSPLSSKDAPVLRALAKAYRGQARAETDPDETRALIRLAKKAKRRAKELEKASPAPHDPAIDFALLDAINDRLRGEAAAANTMLHIFLECVGSDFLAIDRLTYDLMSARDDPKGWVSLPSEVAVKGYSDKLNELVSRILTDPDEEPD